MSDDISIPQTMQSMRDGRGIAEGPARASFTHSYRSRRIGMDVGTKRLLGAACVLGTVLVGGMAVWSFGGHRAAVGVPTVEADTRPLRSRPDNPGGMTAIGVGEQIGAATQGTGDLAPAAEKPDPQALLAQRRASAPAKPAGAPSPAATATAPVAASVPASPAPAAAPAATATPAVRGPMVQLAAVESEAGAATEWQRLTHKLPELLGARSPVVQRADQGGKSFWRLRTGGFGDMADATAFCKRVRARGAGCSIATF